MKTKYYLQALGDYAIKGMYPVLGNLSHNIKQTLEEKLGKEVFNADMATRVSFISNALLYEAAGIYLAMENSSNRGLEYDVLNGYIIGTAAVLAEVMIRTEVIKDSNPASIWGKIISLPIDIYRYSKNKIQSKAKEYEKRSSQ